MRRLAVVLFAAALALTGLVTPASAATFTQTALSATVSGGEVVATTTVVANPATTAARYGVCARPANNPNANLDFVLADNVALSTSGTTYVTPAKHFAPGVYTYFPCVKVGTTWSEPGAKKTFTVTAPPYLPPADPQFATLVERETFDTDAAPGAAYSAYAASLAGYGDSGPYRVANVSAHDGLLDIAMPGGTASAPGTGGVVVLGPAASRWGRTYGEFSITFRAVGATGTGAAFMLWPSSNTWSEGEVDFPEGAFGGTVQGFQHPSPCYPSQPAAGQPYCGTNAAAWNTGRTWRGLHTATTRWSPAGVRYFLDGTQVQWVTSNRPVNNHRFTVQAADPQKGGVSDPGHLLIDSFEIRSYTP